MRYLIALAAVVLLGLAPYGSLCAQSAMAPYPGYGYYGGSGYELSPREIAASVRAKGLQPLSRPQRKGQAYVLRALDAADRELQVTVDAGTGRIVRVAPVAAAAREQLPYPPERTQEEVTNAVPGGSPAARPQAAAPATRPAAQEAAAPPVPRGRPKEVSSPSLSASAADPLPVPPVPAIEE